MFPNEYGWLYKVARLGIGCPTDASVTQITVLRAKKSAAILQISVLQ
eukprot:COSAG05_NODE_466_length_9533_cov_5.547806_2_plen_47_part_00